MSNNSSSTPFVSIVLPTYNRAHCIRRSIQSLLNQTYQNFEIIVADDASTDNTSEIIDKINDQCICYIKHRERRGANAARNTGILAAKGKYIAFQDSDDEWLPDKLSCQIEALEQSDISVCFGGFWRIKGEKKKYIPEVGRNVKNGVKNWHYDLLEGNFFATPTLLVTKELIFEAGLFDETLPRLQDWELALRLAKLTPFMFIDRPLLKAYQQQDSITGKKELYRQAVEQIIRKHQKDFDRYPPGLIIQYLNMGGHALSTKELSVFFFYLFKAAKLTIKNCLKSHSLETIRSLTMRIAAFLKKQ
jgi:glycosyltransferase involved in cell wall biosynthesis